MKKAQILKTIGNVKENDYMLVFAEKCPLVLSNLHLMNRMLSMECDKCAIILLKIKKIDENECEVFCGDPLETVVFKIKYNPSSITLVEKNIDDGMNGHSYGLYHIDNNNFEKMYICGFFYNDTCKEEDKIETSVVDYLCSDGLWKEIGRHPGYNIGLHIDFITGKGFQKIPEINCNELYYDCLEVGFNEFQLSYLFFENNDGEKLPTMALQNLVEKIKTSSTYN